MTRFCVMCFYVFLLHNLDNDYMLKTVFWTASVAVNYVWTLFETLSVCLSVCLYSAYGRNNVFIMVVVVTGRVLFVVFVTVSMFIVIVIIVIIVVVVIVVVVVFAVQCAIQWFRR